jgi:hypothetical protein
MSTNANIGKLNSDGTITAIYLHWDGYLDSAGKMLRTHYTDTAKIDGLLALGDLSVLGAELGEKHDFDEPHTANICTAYGRDRDEDDINAKTYLSIKDFSCEEYNYVWIKNKWVAYDYNHRKINW